MGQRRRHLCARQRVSVVMRASSHRCGRSSLGDMRPCSSLSSSPPCHNSPGSMAQPTKWCSRPGRRNQRGKLLCQQWRGRRGSSSDGRMNATARVVGRRRRTECCYHRTYTPVCTRGRSAASSPSRTPATYPGTPSSLLSSPQGMTGGTSCLQGSTGQAWSTRFAGALWSRQSTKSLHRTGPSRTVSAWAREGKGRWRRVTKIASRIPLG